ncbi:MAG: hypothetical protein K2L32_03390 [Muribaculaceae bacterium]|nr:hypothetical protein [Muribaculaceae bacterium]
MISRTRSSLLNISTGLIGQMLTLLVSFGVRTVFIYELGATYLGLSGLFGNILSLLSFTELGFGQAIIFALYKPISQGDENKIGALMALFRKVYSWMFCIVAILGLALTPFLDYFINTPVNIPHFELIYVLYVFSSATSYLFAYKKSLLFANQKTYVSTTTSYWFTISGAIFQILVLVLWHNFIFYLIVQIANTIIQDIVIARKTDRLYPYLKKHKNSKLPIEEIAEIKRNVKALIIYKLGTLSLNSTDNIIISKFVGLLQVGFYSNYWLICTSVNGFLSTIFSNITASVGHMNATESNETKSIMFYRINMATFWFYGISSICLYTCMTPFILLWLGEEYTLGASTAFIIALNQYIAGMLYSSYNYRQTMGLFTQGKTRPIISAILNIVLSIGFAIYWGLPGVLWGTAITRLTTNAWYDPYIVFKKGLDQSPWPYFKDYTIKIAIYGFTCLCCGYLATLININKFINVILIFIMTLIVSITIFSLCYGKSPQVKYLISIAKNSKSIITSKQ